MGAHHFGEADIDYFAGADGAGAADEGDYPGGDGGALGQGDGDVEGGA